jgi:hypothetical protein
VNRAADVQRMRNRVERCLSVLITQRSQVQILPPPPSTGVFRAFLRTNSPLTSMFGWRLLCLWGPFLGTYSALAYAA